MAEKITASFMALSRSENILDHLQTEARNPVAHQIDLHDTLGLCEAFNHEEAQVSTAIASCLPDISSLINDLVPRLQAGGRLIYVGAGNSGRVGFMDSSELPVTFSVDPGQFITVVAGGKSAIIHAQEGAEDSEDDGVTKLQALQLTPQDTVIGISASGRTPFVLGALRTAIEKSCLSAALTNTHLSILDALRPTYSICVLTGPEFLAGSTRLKAGSAAKQILNMISTCSMIKLGKTYKSLMIDVRVKNHKLRARGRRIVRQVCAGCPVYTLDRDGTVSSTSINVPESEDGDIILDRLIEQCEGSIKLACAVAISGLALKDAKHRLVSVDGNFRNFLDNLGPSISMLPELPVVYEYFLCVDGGGTKCTVSIATRSGVVGRGTAGACNFNCVKLDDIMRQITLASHKAVSQLPEANQFGPNHLPKLTQVWVGLAGIYHTSHSNLEQLIWRLEKLFNVSYRHKEMRLTSDDMLLSSAISTDGSGECGISVIAGTGSVATAFRKEGDKIIQLGRTGGWGYILGDYGSAFDIGKRALQSVLAEVEQSQFDKSRNLTELEMTILAKLGCRENEVLSTFGLARIVTELGFRGVNPDTHSQSILQSGTKSLVQMIKPLAAKNVCHPRNSVLVLSGALMNLPPYKDMLLAEWVREGMTPFMKVVVIKDASDYTAQVLASQSAHQDIDRR
ncbi:N-acetylmuramic acid 6-phosphate etherase, putative [Talaromyces stipitatus ATCC 10500]|uniref:N-acetyl-D-glucosamine kinase n=1 Tax=Talaromyces stipitatus (strain ATCC 10500 / CBS 375.48 / QM 6759 / NRRL 1006) TaxID=441959 RepID=B8MAZ5_TALSN|nr:N-acetylmuramic acid 6-phosphate etherase, putative [Talaromyces stipitatus ATCC 10500]EED18696.1 N-acetylmuramic acid 6-phosphate etherase, putative [Talaromyces stipitatus ATCC 10500]